MHLAEVAERLNFVRQCTKAALSLGRAVRQEVHIKPALHALERDLLMRI